MKRTLWVVVLSLFCMGAMRAQSAGVPALVNYQGILHDNAGNPAVSDYYEIEFRVWDSATGTGGLQWGQVNHVFIMTGGVFNVLLGSGSTNISAPGNPAFTSILDAFNGDLRFLGLTVTKKGGSLLPSPKEIAPRQQLVSAPYAIHASSAATASSAAVAANSSNANNAANANLLDNLDSTAFLKKTNFPTESANPPQVLTWNGSSAAYAPLYLASSKVGIGVTNPQNALHVFGADGAYLDLAPGVHIGRQGGNVHIELVSSGGNSYIDFSNKTNTDYDARIILTPQTNLQIHGNVSMYGNVSMFGPWVSFGSVKAQLPWTFPVAPYDRLIFINLVGGRLKIEMGSNPDAYVLLTAAYGGAREFMTLPLPAGETMTVRVDSAIEECYMFYRRIGLQ